MKTFSEAPLTDAEEDQIYSHFDDYVKARKQDQREALKEYRKDRRWLDSFQQKMREEIASRPRRGPHAHYPAYQERS